MILLLLACTAPDPDRPHPAAPAWAGALDTALHVEPPAPEPPGDLEVRFLAVGGYVLRFGGDAVMTPPLYTNPNLLETTFLDVQSDPELVDRLTADVELGDVRAILVGHAHYDHLLDAPTLWPRTDAATFYGNATMGHILAAYAPDRDPACDPETAPEVRIPRDRVVVVEEEVDARMCGGGAGDWIHVEGTNVRLRALCSEHPDQIGPFHFAPGAIEADLCEPPPQPDDWKEGETLAWLIDFLDPATGRPLHRVYYQDAPTDAPEGLFDPELLDEKAVDVALLNVGSFDAVDDHPGGTLRRMRPRYTIGGHWEDFFRTLERPVLPLIGHDIDAYRASASEAMAGEEPPALVDGEPSDDRQWVPMPGTTFLFGAGM